MNIMQKQTRRQFAGSAALLAGSRRQERPNVIIYYLDELRATALRLYNRDGLETPNLERLARRGVTYSTAVTPHPLCVPARCSLWTGQYTSTHGSRYNQRLLPDDRPSMAGIFQSAGYRLGLFGKNHCFTDEQLTRWFKADYSLGSEAWKRSLSPSLAASIREHRKWIQAQGGGTMPPTAAPFPPEIFETRLISERAMQFIEAEPGKPFLAWVSIPDPHHPVQTPEKYARVMPPDRLKLPPWKPGEIKTKNTRMQIYDYLVRGSELPEPFLRQFLSIYYGMVAFIDDELGRLLDLLDRRGLTKNTIVLFTSDHGDFAAEHHLIIKTGSLLDSMVRVPLVLSWPGRIPEGRREDAPVNHVDITPSLLELCGLAPPKSIEGRRLPVRPSDARRNFVYSEYGNGDPMYTWEDAHQIGPAKQLGDYTLNSPVLMKHLEKRERAGHLRMVRTSRHKLIVDSNGEREFYDLERDPHELTNVAGEPDQRGAEAELEKLFDSAKR